MKNEVNEDEVKNKVNEDEEGNEVEEERVVQTSTGGEVNLGLESKDSEGKGDTSSDTHLDWYH